MIPFALPAFLLSIFPLFAEYEDWPQWRGPRRDGRSLEEDWRSTGRLEPLWSAAVGKGHAGLALAGGRLFTAGLDSKGVDVLTCRDALTGRLVWSHPIVRQREPGDGPLSTPAVWNPLLRVRTRTSPAEGPNHGMPHCRAPSRGSHRRRSAARP